MKNTMKMILLYAVLIGIIIFAVYPLFRGTSSQSLVYSDIVTEFKADRVQSFAIKDSSDGYSYVLTMTVYDTSEVLTAENIAEKGIVLSELKTKNLSYSLRSIEIFNTTLADYISGNSNLVTYEYVPEESPSIFWSILPYLLLFGLLIFVFIYSVKQASSGRGGINNFGKARVKTPHNDKNRVLFSDVAGADEEKAELQEIVEYLKDPAKFTRLGAKIPHGVLLVGPPGTGKTLLAKAVAGEAGVPFYSISGSDFVEMYVGVGASRVRDLFETARKSPASIIFIDEIDAVGRQRGTGLGGGHDEREQTLNQLLVEMDGFGSHDGIIVIAATNRPDVLDPALLRPGRFDRQVTVGYPDIRGREDILKVHARKKPFESGVDFRKIAQTTVGFTGADLANLLNEAALLAARRNKSLIGMDEIEDSYMKIILGPKKKNRVRSEHDNKLTAYHEAGHAVAAFYCKHANPVRHITIIPSGRAGGVTVQVPEADTSYSSRSEMYEDIVVSLGGRIAEALTMEDISSGASADIQAATKTARNMVTRYGMSEKLGPILYGSEHNSDEVFLGRDFSSGKTYSEKTAAEIDDEIRALIEKAYAECNAILSEHMDKLDFVAGFLLKDESMDGDQFKSAMEGNPTYEELEALAEEKRRRSKEDNERQAKENAERAAHEESEKRAAEDQLKEILHDGNGHDHDKNDKNGGNGNGGDNSSGDGSNQGTKGDGSSNGWF